MAKNMTTAELAELSKRATIEYDPEEVNVARIGELIDKLTQLIDQQAARTQADLARSQVQLEVLATLQKNLRKQNVTQLQQVDMSPLKDVLREIQQLNAQRERTAYHFEIKRGEGGYMAGVVATPIEPVKH